MIFEIPKEFINQEIRVPIRTMGPQRVIIKVYHPTKPNTVYFETAPIINGEDEFIVKIPKMPEAVRMDLYTEKNGNQNTDAYMQWKQPTWKAINPKFRISGIMDSNVKRFMDFLDWFAENAGILSAQNSVYKDNDGRFQIDYLDVIRDDNGKELATPLRVNSVTKVIQVAKKHFKDYTVPGRKMWGLHEFAHVWINKDPSNELEADKNAIMIYLGTGNPIIEAYNVIYKCFKNSPSDLNRQRYEQLNEYIKNFNKIQTKQVA